MSSLPQEGQQKTNMASPVIVNARFNPRKCSATGRLIGVKDHASVQISVAEVNAAGIMTGTSKTFALSGAVRKDGESDDSINRLATQAGLLKNVWSAQK